ncbi:hypothetical protein HYPDE_23193 [Hyphomicrobium denitrificans 1NES1]|uniref:Uncharacterized protein n=1 Tax=Hyphomicrobium denitrificans 1NES1 TaxID=670307 RepID=N0B8D5_9HYPH|nr:hypothetical protein HYPDE_23193 [Hyphomicrobium denitrificans 1NES1]
MRVALWHEPLFIRGSDSKVPAEADSKPCSRYRIASMPFAEPAIAIPENHSAHHLPEVDPGGIITTQPCFV